jgi:hypothetical protein
MKEDFPSCYRVDTIKCDEIITMIRNYESLHLYHVSSVLRIYLLRIYIQRREFDHLGPLFLRLYKANLEQILKYSQEKNIDPWKVSIG